MITIPIAIMITITIMVTIMIMIMIMFLSDAGTVRQDINQIKNKTLAFITHGHPISDRRRSVGCHVYYYHLENNIGSFSCYSYIMTVIIICEVIITVMLLSSLDRLPGLRTTSRPIQK